MNENGATKLVIALVESNGGEMHVPVSLLEVIGDAAQLRSWTGLRDGVPTLVLATRLEPEIQGREEEAYAAWRADLRREAVDEATRDVLAWLGVIDSTDASWIGGFYSAVDLIRGARDLPLLKPQQSDGEIPWPTEEQTPASWSTP